MKPIFIKIILTIAVLLLGYMIIEFVFNRDVIHDAGFVELILIDKDDRVVYQKVLYYEENQTFFELLNEHFELTCANQFYQPDNSCSYQFSIMGQQQHIILGIKSNTFEMMTDWDKTFLNIEIYDGNAYVDSSVGVDMIDLDEIHKIRILVDEPRS